MNSSTPSRPHSMQILPPRVYSASNSNPNSQPQTPLQRSLSTSVSNPNSAARKKVDGLAHVLETLKAKVADTNQILARKEQQRKDEARRYKQNLDLLRKELDAARKAIIDLQQNPTQADAVPSAEALQLRTELAMAQEEVYKQTQVVTELKQKREKENPTDSDGMKDEEIQRLRAQLSSLQKEINEKNGLLNTLQVQIKEAEESAVAEREIFHSRSQNFDNLHIGRTEQQHHQPQPLPFTSPSRYDDHDDIEKRVLLSRIGRIETSLRSHLLSESQLLDTESAIMERSFNSIPPPINTPLGRSRIDVEETYPRYASGTPGRAAARVLSTPARSPNRKFNGNANASPIDIDRVIDDGIGGGGSPGWTWVFIILVLGAAIAGGLYVYDVKNGDGSGKDGLLAELAEWLVSIVNVGEHGTVADVCVSDSNVSLEEYQNQHSILGRLKEIIGLAEKRPRWEPPFKASGACTRNSDVNLDDL